MNMAYMIQIDTYIFKSCCCAVNSAKGGGGSSGHIHLSIEINLV